MLNFFHVEEEMTLAWKILVNKHCLVNLLNLNKATYRCLALVVNTYIKIQLDNSVSGDGEVGLG